MSCSIRIGIFLIGFIFMAGAIHAEVYTIDKCIEIALQHNAEVVAAKNSYDASGWGVANSYGRLLPTISIATAQNEVWDPFGLNKTATGSLNIRETFAGFGLANYAEIKSRNASRNSRYYSYIFATQDVTLMVKTAYFNLIKTTMLVDVALDAVKRGEEQLKVAQSRFDLGSAALSDVLNAKVLRSNAKVDLITAQNNRDIAKANLNFVMGIGISQDFEVTQDLPKTAFDITYDQAYNEAISKNSTYRKATFDLASAKADYLVAKTAFLPALSFNVAYGTGADKYAKIFDFEPLNATRSVGFSISYNIFNQLSDITNTITQKKFVNTQENNLENTLNNVALEVKQAYLDVQQNNEKLGLNDESVAAAKEALNIIREKYNLGAATIVEVLGAEVSYKTAQTNQVQALFDYNLAISRLETAMGR